MATRKAELRLDDLSGGQRQLLPIPCRLASGALRPSLTSMVAQCSTCPSEVLDGPFHGFPAACLSTKFSVVHVGHLRVTALKQICNHLPLSKQERWLLALLALKPQKQNLKKKKKWNVLLLHHPGDLPWIWAPILQHF